MVVRLSALSAGNALLPRNIYILFLVLISVRGSVNSRGLVRLEGFDKLKKKQFNNLIGNQTYYLPTCNIVPQPLCYSVSLQLNTLTAIFHSKLVLCSLE
jgi:hypothetical protein